jgi:DNA-binding NarL/FixJ family response regulator
LDVERWTLHVGRSDLVSSILYWLVMGKTNDVIGLNLALAANTIKKHFEIIFGKLGVENRLAAALSAARDFFPDGEPPG